jgi:hypothetical protein
MYKQNYIQGLWKVLLPVLLIGLTGYWFNQEETIIIHAKETQAVEMVTPTPTPILEFATERHEYVYEVFGKDYDKALLVLQGLKDGNGNQICGGENYNLRQEAVNPNYDINGNVWSYDYGVFQINDVYHPVYQLDLDTDWKANIDYAKRMFDNDNGTFAERWSAGKCLRANGYDI